MASLLSKRFVYDPETKEMVEIFRRPREWGQLVVGDLSDFVSPIDGQVVHGRTGLREHDRRHGTTNVADYKETWAKDAQKRAERRINGVKDPRRLETIIRAYDDLKDGRRKPRA